MVSVCGVAAILQAISNSLLHRFAGVMYFHHV
jgi:hypothetical protein